MKCWLLLGILLAPDAARASSAYAPYNEYSRLDFSNNRARAALRDFATCVVKRKASAATAYVLADTAAAADKYIQKMLLPDCLGPALGLGTAPLQLRLYGPSLEFALAEALLRTQPAKPPLADLGLVAGLGHSRFAFVDETSRKRKPVANDELDMARAEAVANTYLLSFGECVVRADPVGSVGIINAEPDTPGEKLAIQSAMPALQACLGSNSTLKLMPDSLRGTIASNYLRLAHAPRTVDGKVAGK